MVVIEIEIALGPDAHGPPAAGDSHWSYRHASPPADIDGT